MHKTLHEKLTFFNKFKENPMKKRQKSRNFLEENHPNSKRKKKMYENIIGILTFLPHFSVKPEKKQAKMSNYWGEKKVRELAGQFNIII